MAVIVDLAGTLFNHPLLSVGSVLLVVVVVFVWKTVFASPNPFSDRSFYRPPAPLVVDPKQRDKVIKQGFHVSKIPDNLDAIVVGSGIGGLATANIMARVGKKVLVLEQHDQAGGCCHTFVDKGFEFDVGIHYVGEMFEGHENRVLIDHLTDGQLQWTEVDKDLDLIALGDPSKKEWFAFTKGLENWRQNLIRDFPEEEQAINTYIRYCLEIKTAMFAYGAAKQLPKWLCRLLVKTGLVDLVSKYFHYARQTTDEVLSRLTSNEKLKLMFAYSFGDFAVTPKKSSVVMQASLVNHFRYGAWYPVGGSSEIALHLIPPIERAGGKVLVRAPVTQILTDSRGAAIGVRVQKTSGDIDILAPTIISDAGVYNTFKQLLPKEVASKSLFWDMLHKGEIKPGIAALSVFVGLRGTTEELGLKACNVWAFLDHNVDEMCDDYLSKSVEEVLEADVPMLFIGFPSAKDPTFNVRYPNKSVCTVVTLVNWEWFERWKDTKLKKRGAEYEELKNHIGYNVWSTVTKMYPQLEDKLEFIDIGSPVSNQYYIRAAKGEMYGLDHDFDRFANPEVIMALRPETDVPGLALTGQDVLTGGFAGALLGALFTAGHLLGRNTYFDLLGLQRRVKKTKEKQKDHGRHRLSNGSGHHG